MKNKGFTLIELMVVTALFAIMLSLSWPSFSGLYRGYQLEITANELKNCIAFARTSSIIEKCRYKLQIEQNPLRYGLFKEEKMINNSTFVSPGRKWERMRELPADIALDGDASEIYFFPNGTSTPAQFSLKGKDTSELTLRVDGYLGSAEIKDTKG